MKSILHKSRLERRFVATVGLGMVLFSILSGSDVYLYSFFHEVTNANELQAQLVETIRTQAEIGVFTKNEPIARDVIQSLLSNPIILAVRIDAVDNFRVEKSSKPAIDFSSGTSYPLFSPINNKEQVGSLVVVQNRDRVNKTATDRSALYALLMVLQTAIATIILVVVFRRQVGEPVTRLANTMKEIKPGSGMYLLIEEDHRHDEIGLLSQCANDLLAATDQALMAKGMFLANMSHEIRTPMNGVMGMIELAINTEPSGQTKNYLLQARKSSRILMRVINDILDFSKIEGGKLTLELLEFHLGDMLNDVVGQFKQRSLEHDIEIIVTTPPHDLGILVGDPLRLQQIIINLTSNAIKFTKQGEVVISVEHTEKTEETVRLHFSVRDTGIGMSEEQQARLFTPFVQADNSITRKFGGTGLGLTICKRLVELMDGKIWLESRPQQGSTFHFTVVLGHRPEPTATQSQVLPQEMQSMKAMVVDDNDTVRLVYAGILRHFGIATTAVASGTAALEELRDAAIKNNPYHLILLDWRMPDRDGIETAHAIRTDSSINRTIIGQKSSFAVPKIILCTAFGQTTVEQEVKRLNLDAYLIKPLTPSDLLNTILSIFGEPLPNANGATQPTVNLDLNNALRGAKILLAEDNEINQQVAVAMLNSVGIHVDIAANGLEAVRMVAEADYDLVLMDIQMPIMDGYSATRVIRAETHSENLPIIAMTAHAMASDQEQSLAVGMNAHICKPIDPEQLFSLLVSHLHAKNRSIADWELLPPGKASPQENNPTWHEIPGIDIKSALGRVMGNRNLLEKLLLDFHRDYLSAAEEVRKSLAEGETERARQISHQVKGIAGNLGATLVQETANALEHAILQNHVHDWPRLTDAFAIALGDALTAITVLNPSTTKTTTAAQQPRDELYVLTETDKARLTFSLGELVSHLTTFSADSLSVFEAIKPLLLLACANETVTALMERIDQFQFSEALVVLESIAKQLGISLSCPGQ